MFEAALFPYLWFGQFVSLLGPLLEVEHCPGNKLLNLSCANREAIACVQRHHNVVEDVFNANLPRLLGRSLLLFGILHEGESTTFFIEVADLPDAYRFRSWEEQYSRPERPRTDEDELSPSLLESDDIENAPLV